MALDFCRTLVGTGLGISEYLSQYGVPRIDFGTLYEALVLHKFREIQMSEFEIIASRQSEFPHANE